MGEQPETESLSIEDRLFAQFEPEQPEAEAPPEQQEEQTEEVAAPESEAQPEFQEIEFEGKTYQVPPELKDALLRQSDYTKKTTEVSERQRALEQKELQIKAVDNERKFHEVVKGDINQIQKIDFQIEQWKSVDVTGMTSEELWKISRQVDQLKDQRAQLSNAITQKWQGFQQEQQGFLQQMRSKAEEHVSKSVKGWGPDVQKALTDYGVSQGYTNEELSQLSYDARYVNTLWKAHQFDKLQSQQIQGKVKTVPTVKPGSSTPMPAQVKEKLALQKTLKSAKNSGDKAKAIERALMSRF
jgi:hypothetical protein